MSGTPNFGEIMRERSTTHGKSGTPIYLTWSRMLSRCRDKNNPSYKHYGGRGISVCKEWIDFTVFFADMGEKPSSKHSLDRIDNEKDYSKDNCRWATWEQQENNRRNNKLITFKGRTQTQSQWAKEIGITSDLILWRLKAKWPISRVLNPKDFRL